MTTTPERGPLAQLRADYLEGAISRRRFIERATMLGISAATIAAIVNTNVAGAQSTPSASPAAATPAVTTSSAPAIGTENQTRGEGGELRIIQWQAPSFLSPHQAVGTKEWLASAPVLEPLLHYLPDATLIPNLVTDVPSQENGLLADDLTSVTYHLLPDVVWSDGEPFTAEDVRFTWEWNLDEANASINIAAYQTIADVEIVDPLTVTLHFTAPNPIWFETGAGGSTGVIYPKHILEAGGEATEAFRLKPIGTGPYVVDTFSVNDQVTYTINENYREPNKPYFSTITLKGGGDAASAARAVIQTGEYDYAWNLSVEPEILTGLEADDSPGLLTVFAQAAAERIEIQHADPNTEVNGQKAEKNTPHPFFSDLNVRKAFLYAIDKEKIASSFYLGGDEEPALSNEISGIPEVESPNTSLVFDPEQAKQVLDEAGWVLDGDVRTKDGVSLSIRYATSVNQLRQKIQALVKSNLEDVGFAVELLQIDAAVYFDAAAGNDQNTLHFYYDIEQFNETATNPRPLKLLARWYAGPDGENIAQQENSWSAANISRYRNADFDAAYEQALTETDPQALIDLIIQLNDIIIEDVATVPLVRPGLKTGISRTLNLENIAGGPFESDYWNIANWNRIA